MSFSGAGTRRLLALLTVLALGACSSDPPPRGPVHVSNELHPLAPGDAIRIGSWRDVDMSGEYNVDESGYATLPMLGRVEVADRDPRELRESLMEGYATQLRDPEIEITFLRRVAILGGVRMPGLYLLDPTMRLADAVALAEGASATGDIQKTKVLRNGTDVTSEVSLSAPLMSQLESGDEIYVPERSWLQRNGVVLMATLISAAAIIYAATIR